MFHDDNFYQLHDDGNSIAKLDNRQGQGQISHKVNGENQVVSDGYSSLQFVGNSDQKNYDNLTTTDLANIFTVFLLRVVICDSF